MTDTDIHLLLTGDELMSGDTVDSNSAMIAQALAAQARPLLKRSRWEMTEDDWCSAQTDNPQRRCSWS